MKEFYLFLLRKYKKMIVITIVIVTLVGFVLQNIWGVLDFKIFFTILLTAYVCIYTWCNGLLAETLPINELSTNNEVISRWLMIFTSTLAHLYLLIVPIFKK